MNLRPFMTEFPTSRKPAALAAAFLVLWLASQPVLAEGEAESPTETPDAPALPSAEEIEGATILTCSEQSYRILVLPDGRAFLASHDGKDADSAQLQPLPVSDPLNPTKSTIVCGAKQFGITSSPPYSNRLVEQRFQLESGEARFAARKESDPTEQMLELATQFAMSGNRDAIAAMDFSNIEYAFQYVNAERIHKILNLAMQRCDRQPCKPLIENTFFLIARLSTAVSGTEHDAAQPTQWILALDDLAVPVADSAPLLLRYAEILKRMNRRDEAMQIVSELVRRDGDSADLHLLFADMLWESGKMEDAKAEYRAFADLIAKDGKTPPERVARLLAD